MDKVREAAALLLEAYDFGQFADDMLDHPSPSCRSPVKSVREALRVVLDSAEFQAIAHGTFVIRSEPGAQTNKM